MITTFGHGFGNGFGDGHGVSYDPANVKQVTFTIQITEILREKAGTHEP